MRRLLDTNAYTLYVANAPEMLPLIQDSDQILMSSVVLGELLYGFQFGSHYRANLDVLERFLRQLSVSVVPVHRTTAERYARIATTLRRKGRPIPANDMWIAAQAIEAGADLVSYDSHFEAVDGLFWVHPQRR